MNMNHLTVETEDTLASLLEFAANNDIDAFKRWVECDLSSIHEVWAWYGNVKAQSKWFSSIGPFDGCCYIQPLPRGVQNLVTSLCPLLQRRKRIPIDPSLPDAKNSIYSTDEFRMFSFRSSLALHYTPMIGLNVHLSIQVKMLEEEIQESTTTAEELRPLYVSTGSAVLSPRSNTSAANAIDFATAMGLIPVQSLAVMLNARDIPAKDLTMLSDFDVQQQQLLNGLSCLSQSSESANSFNRSGSFGVPYGGVCLPRNGTNLIMSSRVSILAQGDKQHQFRSLSSRDLGSSAASAIAGSPSDNWSNYWAVNSEVLGRLRRSSSFELANNGEEPDLSWVQSLVKESPQEIKDKSASRVSGLTVSGANISKGSTSGSQIEQFDQLGA
ncbi:hypothetical protein HAX54_001024 [Datura stramonium]|uniref:Uncharacterized protein n=1 Tax=Datura stramonium TaxID=4076 RepID=A0ABS8T2F9_DATST|nr:hypothetical protein [Datura stramonium]